MKSYISKVCINIYTGYVSNRGLPEIQVTILVESEFPIYKLQHSYKPETQIHQITITFL